MEELLQSPRTPHLFRIWSDLAKQKELPQLDRWLVQRMKQDKRFGSKDRRWYSEAVFAAIRWSMPLLDKRLETASLTPAAAWEALRTLPPEKLFGELGEFGKSLPAEGLASAGLSSWFQASLDRRVALSHWTDQQRDSFLSAQNRRAALWLRLNKPSNKAKVEAKLNEMGLSYDWHGSSLKIESDKNLQQTPILEDGWAEVQDYGSQLLGEKIPVQAAAQIWDCCAGGGGKSLQLAALYPKAHIFSSDIRAHKSTEVSRRAHRAKLPNVTPIPWNGGDQFDLPRSVGKGFDIILVDAPCSGSGTWRRSPDGRFRISDESIRNLQTLQLSIVEKVLPYLKKGGQLVYATCSWLPEENEDVTAKLRDTLPLVLEEEMICGLPVFDADCLFVSRMRKIH